jgi:hypothetical protein
MNGQDFSVQAAFRPASPCGADRRKRGLSLMSVDDFAAASGKGRGLIRTAPFANSSA